MLSTSSAYQTAIKQNERVKDIKIHIETAFETFDLGNDDLKEGTLTVKESAIGGDTLSIGGAVISNLSITLLNTNNRFDEVQLRGSKVTILDGTEVNGAFEYVLLGTFNIDDVSRPTDVETLQGSDNMVLLDRPFKEISVSYPISAKNLMTLIGQHCGLPVANTSFLNSDYMIQAAPDDDLTCRDVVSSIAAIAAGYAHIRRVGGMLEIKSFNNPEYAQEANIDGNVDTISGGDFTWWNNKSYDGGAFNPPAPCVTLGPDNRTNFMIDDAPIVVTGITYQASDKTYQIGSPYCSITMASNPLIQGDPTDVLNSILDKLLGFTYLPFTSDWQGNPSLECGDIIEQIDKKGNHYRTIVTNSTYSYRGSCQIAAKGASALDSAQSRGNRIVSSLQRKITQKQAQINALDEAIKSVSTLIAGIWGGYVVNGDTLADEQYHGNIFICDNVGDDPTNPDVTKAAKVWRFNLGGFGYSETGINGPFLTALGADGEFIASLITAAMIQTGILRSLNGFTQIDLDNGNVNIGDGLFKFSAANGKLSIGNDDLTYDSQNGIKANKYDGTYTSLNGDGLIHHDGSTADEYHYLMYSKEITFPAYTGSGGGFTYANFTLPSAFKGKKCQVSASIKQALGVGTPSGNATIASVAIEASQTSVANGTIGVAGYLALKDMDSSGVYTKNEYLTATVVVIA